MFVPRSVVLHIQAPDSQCEGALVGCVEEQEETVLSESIFQENVHLAQLYSFCIAR